MSNRVDIFQPEQTSMSIPAATFAVFVDGVLCPFLETREINCAQWPEFSRAKLVVNISDISQNNLQALENVLAMGKSLTIQVLYNGSTPVDSKILSYSIFDGHVEKREIKLQSNEHEIKIIARDYSSAMERIIVYGQRIIKDLNTTFLNSFDTIFNPDGKPNASNTEYEFHGKSYKIFCPDAKNAKFWRYADVIHYLLREHINLRQLHIPSLERLLALTGKQVVRDLDVTNLSLIDALQRCCERIGLKFNFVPTNKKEIPAQAIVFYKTKTGRSVEINFPKSGLINISRTNVASMQSKKNYSPVTHRYTGQGDFKVYEATFELIKAWNGSLEDNVMDHFSPSTNPNFYKVRDVFRKWALNEAGDYSSEPYNRGDASDFSRIFESSDYAQRRRRFYPCLTTDSQNRSLGYYLQVSYDNGLTWREYRDAFNILVDECGIWLSSDHLSVDLVVASMNSKLKFRITASVVSDQRLSQVVSNGPVNSVVPVVDHVITLPRQFKYKKVSIESVFAGINNDELGILEEIDDTNALYEFIRHHSRSSSENIESINVQTPVLDFHYLLGDAVISSPDSIKMFSDYGDRSISIIENVHMDFQNQCTNLKIGRKSNL